MSARVDDLVVLCAANNYDGVKLHDQHLAERLAELAPVLYVDPPLSHLTVRHRPELRVSLERPRLGQIGHRLWRLTPVVTPLMTRPGTSQVAAALARRQVRRAVASLARQGSVAALVSAWPLHPVFGAAGERTSVYWAQDDLVGGADLLGIDARRLDRAERSVAAAADRIVASTPTVAATWRSRGYDLELVPYGVAVAAYAGVDAAPPPDDVRLDGPVAGFVGHLNERTDLGLLEAVADRGRSVLVVGPRDPRFAVGAWERFVGRDNVCWVGPKPFDELPRYLRRIDVGLVPYADSAFNRGSFPLKTLEYLAAGRGVVATDLPAIRWLETEHVTIASSPACFADAVDRVLDEPRVAEVVDARRSFARAHSWDARAERFLAAVSA